MLHAYGREDDCCPPRLDKAAESGKLDAAEVWTCPRCGCEYRPVQQGEVKHWQPVTMLEVFQR